MADIPERNFSFLTRKKKVVVKYNVETLMNGRAEQVDSKQFDPGHQNPCTIIKAPFTRSPIKGKRCLGWHSGHRITGSNPFKLFILVFRCAPIDDSCVI